MSINKYRVLLRIECPVPIRFLQAQRLETTVNGTKFVFDSETGSTSMQLIAITADTSIDIAMKRVTPWAQALVTILSYLTQVGLDLKLDRAWEFTPGKRSGPFVQFIHDLPMKPTIERDLDLEVFDRFQGSYNSKPLEDQFRISRAIRWFRAGLQGLHLVDRYLSFWIGLETLDYFLKDSVEHITCGNENCESNLFLCSEGHKQPQRERTLQGVRLLLGNDFRRMKNLRNRLIHGGAKLQDIIDDCRKYVPYAGREITHEINKLLGISNTTKLPPIFITKGSQAIRINGTLAAKGENDDISIEHLFEPFFDLDVENAYLDLSNGSPKLKPAFGAKCDKRFDLQPKNVAIVGEDGVCPMDAVSLSLLLREFQKY